MEGPRLRDDDQATVGGPDEKATVGGPDEKATVGGPDENTLRTLLGRVARRRALNRALQALTDASAAALLVFATLRLIAALLPVPSPLLVALPAAVGTGLLALGLLRCRTDLAQAAAVADTRAALRDELKTALSLASTGPVSPWNRLQLRRAATTARRLRPRRLEPAAAPRRLGVVAGVIVVVAATTLLPTWSPSTADPPPSDAGETAAAESDRALSPPAAAEDRVRRLRLPALPYDRLARDPGDLDRHHAAGPQGADGEDPDDAGDGVGAGAESPEAAPSSEAGPRPDAESRSDPAAGAGSEAPPGSQPATQGPVGDAGDAAEGGAETETGGVGGGPDAAASAELPSRAGGPFQLPADGETPIDTGASGMPSGSSTGPQSGDSLTLAEVPTAELGVELRTELELELATGEERESGEENRELLPTPSRQQAAELPLRTVPLRATWDLEAVLPRSRLPRSDRELIRRYFLARANEER